MSSYDSVEVHVHAPGGNMLTDAKVTLVPRAKLAQLTQSHAFPFESFSDAETNFFYDEDSQKVYIPRKGGLLDVILEEKWFLIVTHTKFNPVFQPLTLTRHVGGVYFAARDDVEAVTVNIMQTKRLLCVYTQLIVDLQERNEVIMMTGTDYSSFGTPFRFFAETRRVELLKEGRTNVGTLVTILSCDDRAILTFVKAKPRKDPLAWLQIHAAIKSPVSAKIVPGRKWPPSLLGTLARSFALSIVDLYEYLDNVGKRRPGTVSEVSIFSHAHIGGPILYNTFEQSQYRDSDNRDPKDFDGRVKDFKPTAMAGWSKLPDAMSPNSNWHLWGCQASRRFVFLAGAGKNSQNKPPNDLITNNTGDFVYKVSLHYIRRTYGRILTEITYSSSVAALLNPIVSEFKSWGAPPGTGSLLTGPKNKRKPNLNRWFLVSKNGNEHKIVIDYLKNDPMFAPYLYESRGIDGERYIDYASFQPVSVSKPNPSPEIYEFDSSQKELFPYDWIYSHVGDPGKTQLTISPIKLSGFSAGSSISGSGSSGTSGHLYVLSGSNPDVGRVFAIDPSHSKRVTVLIALKNGSGTTFNKVGNAFKPPPHSP